MAEPLPTAVVTDRVRGLVLVEATRLRVVVQRHSVVVYRATSHTRVGEAFANGGTAACKTGPRGDYSDAQLERHDRWLAAVAAAWFAPGGGEAASGG